jgi:hypothetical protein
MFWPFDLHRAIIILGRVMRHEKGRHSFPSVGCGFLVSFEIHAASTMNKAMGRKRGSHNLYHKKHSNATCQ